MDFNFLTEFISNEKLSGFGRHFAVLAHRTACISTQKAVAVVKLPIIASGNIGDMGRNCHNWALLDPE